MGMKHCVSRRCLLRYETVVEQTTGQEAVRVLVTKFKLWLNKPVMLRGAIE